MKMQKSFGLQFKGRSAVIAAAAVVSFSATFAGAGNWQLTRSGSAFGKPGQLLTLDTSVNRVNSSVNTGGGRAGADVDTVFTWTGAAVPASNLWSKPTNWANNAAPALSTDDPTFGTLPAGNYTVVDDIAAGLGTLVVNRTSSSDTVTVQGGYRGLSSNVITGKLVLDGGTSTINSLGPTTAVPTNPTAILVGVGAAANGSMVVQNGAVVNYADAFVNTTATSLGSLTVTGAGTKMVPFASNFDSYFGGNTGNANVLIDAGASVTANRSFTGQSGSFKVTNGSTLSLVPVNVSTTSTASYSIAIMNVGSLTGTTNQNWEVSGGSVVTAANAPGAAATSAGIGLYSRLSVGAGGQAANNTVGNILSGGKVTAGIVYLCGPNNGFYGTTPSPAAAPTTGTDTVNVSGVGSTLTATDSLSVGGGVRFGNIFAGTVNFNVLNGGVASGPLVVFGASNRPATLPYTSGTANTPASTSNVVVSGAGSVIRSRVSDGSGVVYFTSGDGVITTNTTVDNGGLIDSDALVDFGTGATGNVNIGANGTITTDFMQAGNGDGTGGSTVNYNVNAGGTLNAVSAVSGDGFGGATNYKVSGAAAKFNVPQFFQTGGFSDSSSGSGLTTLSVSSGGTATLGIVIGGLADGVSSPADPVGTALSVSGAGSSIKVTGYADPTPANSLPAVVQLGVGINNVASISVTNGGLFDINSTVNTANDISGDLEMGNNEGTKATVTVDGVGSTLNAGTGIFMVQADPTGPFENASAIINVKNGGVVNTTGNIQMAVTASANLVATLNIGGGTDAVNDPNSAVLADGTVFVGGSGTAATPTVGSPATVNLNNGILNSGALLVYQGSTVNFTKGNLIAGLMSARGGKILVPASTPAGKAVLEADEFEANNGGYFDIGKGGGVSYFNSTAATPDFDLAEIRTLIKAGYNGGTWDGVNSIRSGAIGSSTKLGIGYADIDISNITSFLGVTFVASDEAIVFRTTLKGDTNCDGTVSFDDLLALAQNYNQPGAKEWYQGDSNYDGTVGFDDLLALAQNYNATYSLLGGITEGDNSAFASDWALAQSLVPEPTTLGLLGGVGMLMGRRRRA